MLYFGRELKRLGMNPEFLLGARSKNDLLQIEEFEKIGKLHISTDDGSAGEHGIVTTNSALSEKWDRIYCCGPLPMMKAIAREARRIGADCEVSLENMMACGLGACLCCVEPTPKEKPGLSRASGSHRIRLLTFFLILFLSRKRMNTKIMKE